jgi:hypothetical protein
MSVPVSIQYLVFHRYMSWSSCAAMVIVFNATFNNISVISWRSFSLVQETADLPQVTEKLYTLSHNAVSSTPRLNGIRTHWYVIGTDCIDSCKSNYHTTAPDFSIVFWNCFDSVVFLNYSDSVVFLNCSDSVVFLNCSDSVVFLNCSDSVVFLNCSDSVVFFMCFSFYYQ